MTLLTPARFEMNVCVTGATGFIGAHVAAKLAAGAGGTTVSG